MTVIPSIDVDLLVGFAMILYLRNGVLLVAATAAAMAVVAIPSMDFQSARVRTERFNLLRRARC